MHRLNPRLIFKRDDQRPNCEFPSPRYEGRMEQQKKLLTLPREGEKKVGHMQDRRQFTYLNTLISVIYEEIKDLGLLPGPHLLRLASSICDKEKRCAFHQDHGHTTDQCLDLKEQI